MRNKFDSQLEKLNLELITMGALSEDAISASVKGFLDDDDALCQKAVETEDEINRKERDIESICMKLLLEQQPVARDLRVISSALKMISDMERIGDQAYDIAEIAKFIKNSNVKSKIHIKDMATAATKMVTDSVDAYVRGDLKLAEEVCKYDDVVDNDFSQIKKTLIEMIAENPLDGEYALDILMIAKYFERIGDHAVNIAEWVEFSVTGVHKKF